MATRTWSTTLSNGTYQGTTWQSYTLSGTALPSGAVITDIRYKKDYHSL